MTYIEEIELSTVEEILPFIDEGDIEKVDSVIKNYHCSHSVDVSESKLLHYAVGYGNEKLTQYLLNRGYCINSQDVVGTTPLMIAVTMHYEVIIKMLLEAGADIMILDCMNKSVLHMICKDYNLQPSIQKLILCELLKKFSTSDEIAQKLIDAGCHLYQAAYLSNAKILEYMLRHGFPVNSVHPISKLTALHIAVSLQDLDSVKVLLEYNANADMLEINDSTPLFYLYEYCLENSCKQIDILQMLLEKEISLTVCNSEGFFQISLILVHGNSEAIRFLLQANIDFTAKDKIYGGTVLHYLAANNNPGVTEELQRYVEKYDVNLVDDRNLNSLYVAVKNANVNMVKFLLSQGATPNCAHNLYGYTPLYCAYSSFKPGVEKETEQCVELLLQYNADPQIIISTEDGKKSTIFDIATETNSISCLKSVIAHLGILEKQGTMLTEVSLAKINSCKLLKKYFNRCQKLLEIEISGSVTIFKLLTSSTKQMAKYLNNEKLVLKLIRLSYKPHLKFLHPYYYFILEKKVLEGIQYKRFLDGIVRVICKISGDRFNQSHPFVDKVISYLNDESLQQLYQLSTDVDYD